MSAASGRTTLVVPCYNEAERLSIGDYRTFLVGAEGFDLLFVDDGSTDDTFAVLTSMAVEAGDRIQVLRLAENCGKGEAVRRGMLAAIDEGARYVGFWDADLATPLNAAVSLRAVLEEDDGVDWVLGSRVLLLGRRIERRVYRHYLGRVFATFFSLWLKLPVYDTQCGAKLFRSSPELEEILARPFVSRWLFDVELLARLIVGRGGPSQVSGSVVEVPLAQWRDVGGSKLGIRSAATVLRDLIALVTRYPLPRRVRLSGAGHDEPRGAHMNRGFSRRAS